MNASLPNQNQFKDLNEKQIEAVTLQNESALILAGAGSGKTKVLTSRISWLIQTNVVSPFGLIAVTFTNKAAKEMLQRITMQLPINTRGMWVGTFHGLCNRFLKTHARDADLPDTFQILDSQDQLSLIKRTMKTMNVDDETYAPKQVQHYINGCKDEGLRAAHVDTYDTHSKKLNEIYLEYEKQCQKEGLVDFGELLLRCYELFEKNVAIRQHYQDRFKHILIDEFQDTSELQYKWLKLLAGNSSFVFAVGDDDQSIYSFRGARVGNMKNMERDFHVKQIIKLEQNYRSKSNILNTANAIIDHNKNRLGKNLWTSAGEGDPIRIYTGHTDIDEAKFIVDEIKMLHREGISLNHIAILYRSNAQSRVLEHNIFSSNLPYRVYGGLRFFERAEIKHAIAYLRLIANKNDDSAFLRIVNFPTRGIGSRSLESLQDISRRDGCSLWDAAQKSSDQASAIKKGLPYFIYLIKHIENSFEGLTLPQMIDLIINESGLKDHYTNEKDGLDRVSNLNELVSAAATFLNNDNNESLNPLGDFLNYSSLESGDMQASEGADAIQLMTIHSSKGLEFDVVFISGLEEGLCPHEQSLFESKGLEEERRLMYVAVTRARSKLYLSYALSRMLHGQTRYGMPSRFLEEIPESLVKNINTISFKNNVDQIEENYSQPSQQKHTWRIGESVMHEKFGQGTVLGYEGNSDDLRIQIKFNKAGTKWLAMEYAKLFKR